MIPEMSILSSIIFLVISIIVLVHFFRISKDIRFIKLNFKSRSNKNSEAIMYLLDGNVDDAIKLVEKQYKIDVIDVIESYRHDASKYDKEMNTLKDRYIDRYKKSLPKLNHDFFTHIQADVEKLYFNS